MGTADVGLQHYSLCPQRYLQSAHLPTSEGWTAELAVGLWLIVPTTGLEPTRADKI